MMDEGPAAGVNTGAERDMIRTIRGLKVHYEVVGKGHPVLLLHGWGGSSKSMAPVQSFLSDAHEVISLDLPGFGESTEPSSPWTSFDYAAVVADLLKSLGLDRVAIIGHSFGGKIAIHLALMGYAHRLVLTNSAGIRPTRSLRYYIRVGTFKFAKRISQINLLRKLLGEELDRYRAKFGSADYRNASSMMRQVLVRIVNEDISPLLSQIQVPTLLIWGDLDTATPLQDAKRMESLIPDCGLVVLKGAGHFSFLDKPREFEIIVKHFLNPPTSSDVLR